MIEEKHRKHITILFIAGTLFVLAILASSWNAFVAEKENLGFVPAFCTIISIGLFSLLFRTAFIITDVNAYNDLINSKISEGRDLLQKELKEKEETEKKKESDKALEVELIKEEAKTIIPAGNFKNIDTFSKKLLNNLANELNAVQGVFYIYDTEKDLFVFSSGYGLTSEKKPEGFKLGENITGEAAKNGTIMRISDIPHNYFKIESGLGETTKGLLTLIPVQKEKKHMALIEIVTFSEFSERKNSILEEFVIHASNKIQQIVKA